MSRLPFIGFPVEMNERKMLLSFITKSRRGTKRVPHNIRGTNIQSNNLRGTLSRDSFTRCTTSRATRTAYGNCIQATHSSNALTLNALRKQQFSSRRRLGEFSQIESPTRQGWNPCLSRRVCLITRPFCRNDHSGDDRDGRAAVSSWRKGCTVALCAGWRRLAAC